MNGGQQPTCSCCPNPLHTVHTWRFFVFQQERAACAMASRKTAGFCESFVGLACQQRERAEVRDCSIACLQQEQAVAQQPALWTAGSRSAQLVPWQVTKLRDLAVVSQFWPAGSGSARRWTTAQLLQHLLGSCMQVGPHAHSVHYTNVLPQLHCAAAVCGLLVASLCPSAAHGFPCTHSTPTSPW